MTETGETLAQRLVLGLLCDVRCRAQAPLFAGVADRQARDGAAGVVGEAGTEDRDERTAAQAAEGPFGGMRCFGHLSPGRREGDLRLRPCAQALRGGGPEKREKGLQRMVRLCR